MRARPPRFICHMSHSITSISNNHFRNLRFF
uniref:Uncharacterized protein n=1 Tax=Arundo donax TaxID=35708 RepID=A0A0A9EAD6_ARUDO